MKQNESSNFSRPLNVSVRFIFLVPLVCLKFEPFIADSKRNLGITEKVETIRSRVITK